MSTGQGTWPPFNIPIMYGSHHFMEVCIVLPGPLRSLGLFMPVIMDTVVRKPFYLCCYTTSLSSFYLLISGIVNTFLSCKTFRFLGRISYSVFLTHLAVLLYNAAVLQVPRQLHTCISVSIIVFFFCFNCWSTIRNHRLPLYQGKIPTIRESSVWRLWALDKILDFSSF